MSEHNDPPDLTRLLADVLNQAPIPISVYDRNGVQVAFNDANGALWGIRREDTVGRLNMITDPQLAAAGSAENHRRVMQGEMVIVPAHTFDSSTSELRVGTPDKRWVEAIYFPVRDESGEVAYLGAILRDVTVEIQQREEIERARTEIAEQRRTIESLSSPVIQVWQGILTMPLIGTIDSRRAMQLTEDLLRTVAEQRARCVILDITGVPVVDTQVAQHLLNTSQACKLLGCEAVLVGVGVEVAQTLVQLGVSLEGFVTLANLQAGIEWAFERLGLQVVKREQK